MTPRVRSSMYWPVCNASEAVIILTIVSIGSSGRVHEFAVSRVRNNSKNRSIVNIC